MYAGPSAIPASEPSRHPVPFGFTVASQAPAVLDGAVGGSGSSETPTGSGAGAGGLSRTAGIRSFAQSHCGGSAQLPKVAQALPPLASTAPESWHIVFVAVGVWSSSVNAVDAPAAQLLEPQVPLHGEVPYKEMTELVGVMAAQNAELRVADPYESRRPAASVCAVHGEPSALVPTRV